MKKLMKSDFVLVGAGAGSGDPAQREKCSLIRLKRIAQILDVDLLLLINENNRFIQQNINQQGGNAASHIAVSSTEGYQYVIDRLEREITELKREKLQA